MTTLHERPNTALIVIDVQNGVVANVARRDEVVANINALVDKTYPDSFEDTNLEDVLAERGVGRLIIAGAQTDECIRSTLHGGFTRGYDVTLVEDAHTTEDGTAYGAPPPEQVIAHTNLYWKYHTGPGRQAGTVSTAEASFTPDSDAR